MQVGKREDGLQLTDSTIDINVERKLLWELRGMVDLSTKRFDPFKTRNESYAGVTQLAVYLTCNQDVGGSSPFTSLRARNSDGRVPRLQRGGRVFDSRRVHYINFLKIN